MIYFCRTPNKILRWSPKLPENSKIKKVFAFNELCIHIYSHLLNRMNTKLQLHTTSDLRPHTQQHNVFLLARRVNPISLQSFFQLFRWVFQYVWYRLICSKYSALSRCSFNHPHAGRATFMNRVIHSIFMLYDVNITIQSNFTYGVVLKHAHYSWESSFRTFLENST